MIKTSVKKITIILPNLLGGGAEKNFNVLSSEWSFKNIVTEFVLLEKKGIFLKNLQGSTKIINLNAKNSINAFYPILNYLKKNTSDIIIVNLWPLTIITLIANLLVFKKNKIIIMDHQILSKSYSKRFNNYRWYLNLSVKLFYNLADKVFCVSNSVKKDLMKMGVKKNKIDVIYNPINLKKIINKSYLDFINNFKKKSNLILAVGSFKLEKDFQNLIKAFKILNKKIDIKLIIIGDGPLFKEINKYIYDHRLENKIHLPGFIEDLYVFYKLADVFVISSIHEGFGNVVVESLSAGTSVVSTSSGGPEEILDYGRFGTIAKPEDSNDLSDKILYKLMNKDKPDLLIDRSKVFSKEYISEIYLHKIMEVINN